MIDTSIIESPCRDTSPQVYAGLPAQAYVPNPYDFGRPAIVYPGDSVYYSAPEPHDKARAADTVLDAVRRTACAYMNQALRVSPAQAYVPNPYDFGRPAIVYPGDSVYYSAPEPHDKARAADTVLDAVRRTACAYMNQALRVSPAQAAAMEAGIQYGWSDPRANPANYTAAGDYCGQ